MYAVNAGGLGFSGKFVMMRLMTVIRIPYVNITLKEHNMNFEHVCFYNEEHEDEER